MVQNYHRLYMQQLGRKGEINDEAVKAHREHVAIYYHYYNFHYKKSKLGVLSLVLLFSLLTFGLLLLPCLSPYPLETEEVVNTKLETLNQEDSTPCTSIPNNTICCDRTGFRSDICFMRGDIRTHSESNSILLINASTTTPQTIKPYTRKWEASVMATIDELKLHPIGPDSDHHRARPCDVTHSVPAVVYSTGGYTGNVYHEFNDAIIPLYITSNRFDRRVVFVFLEYHDWWNTKYREILNELSDYPPLDFANDKRTHCFSQVIVGGRIHDELSIAGGSNETIWDFRRMLDKAYGPSSEPNISTLRRRPTLVIISRRGSRKIENELRLVKLAETVGFQVRILRPNATTELAKIYRELSLCDVMVGVHGAAMTHFLFMRPGRVFVQIVPLGTEWAARTYYGEPARKMGLKYIGYEVSPSESSLYSKYERDDPVLRDPGSVNAKGWEFTKSVYLDGQNVKVDLVRFRRVLVRARRYVLERRGVERS